MEETELNGSCSHELFEAGDASGVGEACKVCLKVHRYGSDMLVALCDEELIGKRFEEGNLQLEPSPGFFGDRPAEASKICIALDSATIANIVGERAIALALKASCIEKDNVMHICGVPTAQMVRM
jgi:hypothetical protein